MNFPLVFYSTGSLAVGTIVDLSAVVFLLPEAPSEKLKSLIMCNINLLENFPSKLKSLIIVYFYPEIMMVIYRRGKCHLRGSLCVEELICVVPFALR